MNPPIKLTKSQSRLLGWLKYRIKKSSRTWIKVNLKDEFCQMTGLSEKTARRALDKLRDNLDEFGIVFRSVHQNRRWAILASSTQKLHKAKRSEPLPTQTNGRKRVVKTSKNGGIEIHQEQLRLGEDKIYWREDSPATKLPSNQEEDPKEEDPRQQTFDSAWESVNEHIDYAREQGVEEDELIQTARDMASFLGLRVTDIFPRVFNKENFPKENKDKRCKGSSLRNSGLDGLAWTVSKSLKRHHWDNCKIKFDLRHSFNLVKRHLQAGYDKSDIVQQYEIALHRRHQDAVDCGQTSASWSPSSTVSLTSELLRSVSRRWTPTAVHASNN